MNWIGVLQSVPAGEDIHVISEDGDFFSAIDEDAVHPFLQDEWVSAKRSSIHVYRTLSAFMKEGGLKSEVQHLASGKVFRCKAELRTNNFSLRSA